MILIDILYVLLAVLLFGVLIFIHELGHYIAARLSRVRVLEFAIGMGPKLLKWRSKKTGILYSLRAFPLGGFCSMDGEGKNSNPTENPNAEENREPFEKQKNCSSYADKKAYTRLGILLAGPAMNIILGFLLTFVMVIAYRQNGEIMLGSTVVAEFDAYAVSQNSGLMLEDKIIKVGNVRVHTAQELSYEIMIQGKKAELYDHNIGFESVQRQVVSLDLTVIRNGEKKVLNDVKFLSDVTSGTRIGLTDFRIYRENASFGNIMKQSFFRALSSVKMVWDSLVGIITGRFALSSVSGPVGTTQVIVEAAQTGWYTLLNLFIVISMNLGVFNLLPFLPLDGGHILFCLYEIVFRKPVPQKFEEYCQIIGVLLMFGLMIVVLVKDVINLF